MANSAFSTRLKSFLKWLPACVALAAASALLAVPSSQAATDIRSPLAPTGTPVAAAVDAQGLFDQLAEAAEQGDVESMNLLGVLSFSTARAAGDYAMALYWFQRAADAGSPVAMHNLAHMYFRGLGASRDYANAFRWFLRAAEAGNPQAMHGAAAMAENGLGTERDLALARSLYRKAAEGGLALAMIWVSDDLSRGGANQDLVAAYAWLEVAALCDIDSQLQVSVIARMEDLGDRLGAVKRDEARSLATRTVADIRARASHEPSPRVAPASRRPGPSA